MEERRNMMKYLCLQIIQKVYILLTVIQDSTDSDVCVKPSSTVIYVSTCPVTDVEWQISSLRKNCSQYSDKCGYKYHCLINPFLNATLEVCAQRANIIERKCAEFNPGGEVIQENSLATCQKAGENCPYSYSSTTAYKYPGCYNLTKQQHTSGKMHINQNKENSSQRSFEVWKVILICLCFVIVIGIVIFSIIWWKRRRRQSSLREGSKKESEPFVQTSEKSEMNTNETSNGEHPRRPSIINVSPDPTYYTAKDKTTSEGKRAVFDIFDKKSE
ncbi:uncharacterized protein LOC134238073 [Saccostrea cucullata]|uniref:uncharacterized protein LOC134238073 n=1 Tax=Saccostrea cuccullata TaxID=36930 RepID=UPI002ED25DDA